MYCKHCGKEIAKDSKFCQYCGAELAKSYNHSLKNILNNKYTYFFFIYFIIVTILCIDDCDDGAFDTSGFIREMLGFGILLPSILCVLAHWLIRMRNNQK